MVSGRFDLDLERVSSGHARVAAQKSSTSSRYEWRGISTSSRNRWSIGMGWNLVVKLGGKESTEDVNSSAALGAAGVTHSRRRG